MSRKQRYIVDWDSDKDFPCIVNVYDLEEGDIHADYAVTFTEAKRLIIEHAKRKEMHWRIVARNMRSMTAKEFEELRKRYSE